MQTVSCYSLTRKCENGRRHRTRTTGTRTKNVGSDCTELYRLYSEAMASIRLSRNSRPAVAAAVCESNAVSSAKSTTISSTLLCTHHTHTYTCTNQPITLMFSLQLHLMFISELTTLHYIAVAVTYPTYLSCYLYSKKQKTSLMLTNVKKNYSLYTLIIETDQKQQKS